MTDKIPPKANPHAKRILVIDDEESIRDLLKMTLMAEGFQVKTARDGRNISNDALSYEPHLVICDLMMPGGGGYEVIRSLQTETYTRDTPVLVISGRNVDRSTIDMLEQESNMKGFIAKPLRPVDFLMRVHAILNTKSTDEKMVDDHRQKISQKELGELNIEKYGGMDG